jgi:hypothetical protein
MLNVDDAYSNNKKTVGKYYDGFFSDGHGNPDFKGLGPILKGVFYFFIFSIIISSNNWYFIIPLLLFFVGKILTAIRFRYVDTLNPIGNDVFFIQMNTLENDVEGYIALFIALYLMFHIVLEKKK